MQQNFRGRPGGDDDRFAFQIREIFNIAAFFSQQSRPDDENRIGEGGLFLALKVVSR
ncbi:hypothetical protein SEEC5569_14585 [Salmonella enterica subsp. enterica serovar Cerro str. 5569]|nr:hypothetical protein SEEC5569_14585 [Salmonella enterica subsp. enterica serovar Cerro str. 5569]